MVAMVLRWLPEDVIVHNHRFLVVRRDRDRAMILLRAMIEVPCSTTSCTTCDSVPESCVVRSGASPATAQREKSTDYGGTGSNRATAQPEHADGSRRRRSCLHADGTGSSNISTYE